jgi:hypothetical protein
MQFIKGWVGHATAVADFWNAKAQDSDSWWYGAPTTRPRARKNREAANPKRVASCAPARAAMRQIASRSTRLEEQYARQDSNLQPSVPKTDALSNCATGAWQFSLRCSARRDKRGAGAGRGAASAQCGGCQATCLAAGKVAGDLLARARYPVRGSCRVEPEAAGCYKRRCRGAAAAGEFISAGKRIHGADHFTRPRRRRPRPGL